MSDNRQHDRRETVTLSDDDLKKIADAAVDRALERLQLEIGRSILRRLSLWAGAAFLALAYWFYQRNGGNL